MIIKKNISLIPRAIFLPASKSISNRVLMIEALSGQSFKIEGHSEARDTAIMQKLLLSDPQIYNVLDAGTAMRFLTAYLSVMGKKRVITGTDRMQQRPISILVDSLTQLGASIKYLNKNGYPPLKIEGFKRTDSDRISIKGDVSSQYISAIMMIAPLLEKGLEIELIGKIGSRPYIEMTASIMEIFGVKCKIDQQHISIEQGEYAPKFFTVERDWSAAGYWYSLVALSENLEISLEGLTELSLQGDRVMADIMRNLGVETVFNEQGAILKKTDCKTRLNYDFNDCPDLAQTVAVVCAAKGVEAQFTGLESLKIKETDRVAALKSELAKINAELIEDGNRYYLKPSVQLPHLLSLKTYDDHRMAMAFAPLATLMDVEIDHPSVVNKSYPKFWEHLAMVGLSAGVID